MKAKTNVHKNKKPLVSILIPNYNYESTIAETIESALNQTYPNIEIIVLDNKSTDRSYEVAKRYRSRGVRVYQNKVNIGVNSHNILFNLARGKYIHILHSDDAVLPEFITTCVELMEDHPNVGLTVTERIEMDKDSHLIDTAPPFYDRSCIIPGASEIGVLMMASYFVPSQTVFRKDVLERVGLYTLSITNFMDWWLLYKCCCISDLGCIIKPLCRYRIWPASQTTHMIANMTMPITGFLNRWTMAGIEREKNNKEVIRREKAAVHKQADLTLKLGVDALRMGADDLGKKYLELAQAMSLEIAESELFLAIYSYLYQNEQNEKDIDKYLADKNLAGKRNRSYEPPSNYIAIE